MRLDKFLVDCGVGSRTEVKNLLKKKQVTVDGQIETSPKLQIDENTAVVAVDGQKLTHEQFVYYLLNKPQGVISATEDRQHRTVLDLLDETAQQKSVFPVGRLDIDTEGLLLLTNNGPLAHAMLSPKKHVDKVYQAEISGIMDEEDVAAFKAGISLSDHDCQPAILEILTINLEEKSCRVTITIREGKFHQVKRMVAARGKKVTALQRLSMGPLVLDDQLKTGEFRRLTTEEMASLEQFGISL